MSREDSVKFTCDVEDCTANIEFHEAKDASFVPDGWAAVFEDEEDAVYRCDGHETE